MRQVVERWFLVEPLLFAAWTTHNLSVEPRIRTLRVREGRIEYNPAFIDNLDRRELEALLRVEAVRILLKHPYQRRKRTRRSPTRPATSPSEYLQTALPLPSARTVFGTDCVLTGSILSSTMTSSKNWRIKRRRPTLPVAVADTIMLLRVG